MRVIDLTHTFAEPMPVFPGDPPPHLRPCGELDGAPMFELTTGMHVGTHIDAPLHVFPNGTSIADLPAGHFSGPGVLVDARGQARIDLPVLNGVELCAGAIVVVCTGFGARFREQSYYTAYPDVTEEFATALAQAKVRMLALDTPSPDRAPYAIHKLLLSQGVLIAENLTNVEALFGAGAFELIALPLKLQAEASPARVVARLSPH
jgi:kynurenine formamidase